MFPSKNDLNGHIKETHKTHKPCNKFPGNRCEYDDDECRYRHIILQQGEHICYKCGEITTSRTNIMNHIKEIHGNILCHKFLLNKCTYFSRCLYSHSGTPGQCVERTPAREMVTPSAPLEEDFPSLPTSSPMVGAGARAQPRGPSPSHPLNRCNNCQKCKWKSSEK